jgi:hypothetical protein
MKSNTQIWYTTALFRKNDFKPLENIRMIHAHPETYTWMLDNIVSIIVGDKYFRSECKKILPTTWLPTNSKAFAVLYLENYYNHVADTAGD